MQNREDVNVEKDIYDEWMEKEGIPVYQEQAGIEDITELPRRPWARMGGLGTFIWLESTKQASKQLYVAEIPPGGALEPEKHLYDELLFVLRGRGLSEVWHEGQRKVTFEWGEGSLFAIPLNAWHRLVNGSQEPVLIFGQSNAPLLMNTYRSSEFIFNCDYNFTDRFTGKTDYFVTGEKRYRNPGQVGNQWDTNFVLDVRTCYLPAQPEKAEGGHTEHFNMAAWRGSGAAEWPVGKYHKAHFHGPGAILLGLKSEGYVLLWPRRYGIHPFQDGHGDKVIKVNWKPNSIYSPENEWFHQHFNTGKEPARHLRVVGGGYGMNLPTLRKRPNVGYDNIRDGGRLIEYDDEDPGIRRMFEEELRKKGIKCTMKPVVYRTDPFEFSV